jgi:hypothetical protein
MGTDKHGRPLAAYPETAECGRLLGVNVFGNTVYTTAETIAGTRRSTTLPTGSRRCSLTTIRPSVGEH